MYSSYLCDRVFKDSSEVTSIFRVLRRRCWGDIIQVLDAIAYSKQASGKDYHNGWIKIEQSKLALRTGYTRSYISTQILELQAVGLLELYRDKFDCYRYKFTPLAREIFSAIAKLPVDRFAEIKSLVRDGLHQFAIEFSKFTAAPSEQIIGFWSHIRESLTGVFDDRIGDVQLSPYIQDPFQEPLQNNQLTTSQLDVVIFSADKPETPEIPISEPATTQPLAKSETLFEENLPATCDNLTHYSVHSTPKAQPPKPNPQSPAPDTQLNYQIELAAIGVAVQNVEWIIRQIPKIERDRVVSDAIAWVSEQKWVEQPAAAFVSAIRGRKKSAKLVDEELRQIINTHQTEAQQFSQWYASAKRRGRVEYSQGSQEHYALVTLPDGLTMPWQQARDYLAVSMQADEELEAVLSNKS